MQKKEQINKNGEMEMGVGITVDINAILMEAGLSVEEVIEINNERNAVVTIENPEMFSVSSNYYYTPVKEGSTLISVVGDECEINVSVNIKKIDKVEKGTLKLYVGEIYDLTSFSIFGSINSVKNEDNELFVCGNKIVAINEGLTTVEINTDNLIMKIPVNIEYQYDYTEDQQMYICKIFDDAKKYKELEEVLEFSKGYIEQLLREKEKDKIITIYEKFSEGLVSLIEEMSKELETIKELKIKEVEAFIEPFKEDENVKTVMQGYKEMMSMLAGTIEEVVSYTNDCKFRLYDKLWQTDEYFNYIKEVTKDLINKYYENCKDYKNVLEIKNKYISLVDQAQKDEVVYEYYNMFVDELENIRYIDLNIDIFKNKAVKNAINNYQLLSPKLKEEFSLTYDEFLKGLCNSNDAYESMKLCEEFNKKIIE